MDLSGSSAGDNGGSGGSGGSCFISTTAYGSSTNSQESILRKFLGSALAIMLLLLILLAADMSVLLRKIGAKAYFAFNNSKIRKQIETLWLIKIGHIRK